MDDDSWGWIFLILITIGVVWFFFIRTATPSSVSNTNIYSNINYNYPTEKQADNLTSYLNSIGVTYYYSSTDCAYCNEQDKYINLALLNGSVDLNGNPNNNIKAIPAWSYNGTITYGMLTYSQLKSLYNYNG